MYEPDGSGDVNSGAGMDDLPDATTGRPGVDAGRDRTTAFGAMTVQTGGPGARRSRQEEGSGDPSYNGRRVGLYAGFCHPVASRRPGRRPSI
jgi:hypothetical protein